MMKESGKSKSLKKMDIAISNERDAQGISLSMTILVLCMMLDGSVDSKERELYRKCITACGFAEQWGMVEMICEQFRRGKTPVTVQDVLATFDPASTNIDGLLRTRGNRCANRILECFAL